MGDFKNEINATSKVLTLELYCRVDTLIAQLPQQKPTIRQGECAICIMTLFDMLKQDKECYGYTTLASNK